MGASFVCRTKRGTPEEVANWALQQQHQDAFEHGHSYSGHWNMCHGLTLIKDKIFDSVEDASDYLQEHCEKGENLLGVRARFKPTATPEQLLADKVWTELVRKRDEAHSALWGQDREIVARAKSSKSLFKACSSCQSKINLKHVRHVSCPVCNGNLLRTPTDDKKQEALKATASRLNAKIEERAAAVFKKANPKAVVVEDLWVIAGLCAS